MSDKPKIALGMFITIPETLRARMDDFDAAISTPHFRTWSSLAAEAFAAYMDRHDLDAETHRLLSVMTPGQRARATAALRRIVDADI